MGHWEQVGMERLAWLEQRQRLPRWRRVEWWFWLGAIVYVAPFAVAIWRWVHG
jgi:hypothetical protein